jgi:hypothetical protein
MVSELLIDLNPCNPATQDASGRLDFRGGFPVGHVGMTTLAALTAFNFFGTDIAQKFSRQNILAGFLGSDFFHEPGLDERFQQIHGPLTGHAQGIPNFTGGHALFIA